MGLHLPILRTTSTHIFLHELFVPKMQDLFIVPRVGKCTLGGIDFSYRAPLLWNNLPSDIRGADSLSILQI